MAPRRKLDSGKENVGESSEKPKTPGTSSTPNAPVSTKSGINRVFSSSQSYPPPNNVHYLYSGSQPQRSEITQIPNKKLKTILPRLQSNFNGSSGSALRDITNSSRSDLHVHSFPISDGSTLRIPVFQSNNNIMPNPNEPSIRSTAPVRNLDEEFARVHHSAGQFSNISVPQGSCITQKPTKTLKKIMPRVQSNSRGRRGISIRDVPNNNRCDLDVLSFPILESSSVSNTRVESNSNIQSNSPGPSSHFRTPIRNLDSEFAAVHPSATLPNSAVDVNTNVLQSSTADAMEESSGVNNNDYPSYKDIGDCSWTCEHCSAMFWYDERIEKNRKKTTSPLFSLCCCHGKIKLPPLREPPEEFKQLLYGTERKSKKFQSKMRMFNMIFAFTSMGGKIDRSFNTGTSAPTFRVNGDMIHLMGSLLPEASGKASFAQLYIHDTQNEINNRVNCVRKDAEDGNNEEGDNDDVEIVESLKDLLDRHNILVKWFRTARDRFRDDETADIKLRLISRRTQDGRVHNLPQVDEIAALIEGDIENLEMNRDIIVERKSKSLQRINELHPSYLPLQYPLLYFYGEDGYRDDIPHEKTARSTEKKPRKVTMKEYFTYFLQHRATQSLHLLYGRRLFQQFVVDAYAMVESFRLTYMRHHQKDLRCGSYSSLGDALAKGDSDVANTGKRIILPSSFVGGARYMIQNYHDAMAICRWLGYPNLFITFTCNAKWREVTDYLKENGLNATDRPDIISRVFHAKLEHLMDDIRKGKLFGETAAVIYTIEFQKRGLPHAHILLFLKNQPTSSSTEVVDKFISAEIPDPLEDKEYHAAVKEFMMHGPCGHANLNSPCMNGVSCTKSYPKKFVDHSSVDQDGFVVYKRRNNGRTVFKGGIELDNRHVIPHNSFLLKRYRAHINVEWCNRARSIKYLFKYVHKGNDRATAMFYKSHRDGNVGGVIDEIQQYLDCRYISSSEATWRLFSYEIHFREPTVVRLKIHLKDEQFLVFEEGETVDDVMSKPSSNETMFTAWMIANRDYEEARHLTYGEFPSSFVWHADTRTWTPRIKGKALGRLSYVHPAMGDVYYMRLLLNFVRGCTSYEDISFYNGKQYKTFKEACYARGLLDDDQEYIDAIKEAAPWGSGTMLRSLFVNLLTSCSIVSPCNVWKACHSYLMEDLLRNYRIKFRRPGLMLTDEQLQNLCLKEIETLLQKTGKSLKDYSNMPYPQDVDVSFFGNSLLANELNYNREELSEVYRRNFSMLNDQQLHAYESIMESLSNGRGQVFFLYGYGGTGKTFVWKTISAAIRSRGEIVLNVASSGIASLLLPGGRTAHSKFHIPLVLTENATCNIETDSDSAEMISKANLIIWDEAPMMHRNCFEALDRTIRDIMSRVKPDVADLPFGGKVIVFGGDFRQILPVIQKGTRQEIIHATINSSPIWNECKILRLTKNMRLENVGAAPDLANLREFADWMSNIGDGTLGEDNDGYSTIEIPQDLLISRSDDYIGSMVQEIFPDFDKHIGEPEFLEGRAILAPTLDEVEAVNEYMVSLHSTEEKVYLSADSIDSVDKGSTMFDQMHSVEFLNTIKCSGLPNHTLKLKVGVPIMLLRNIDHTAGLCNGTRLVITKMGTYVIEAKVLGGEHKDEIVYIPRMALSPSDSKLPFRFQRRQFPIMISYAMSINKSQGQSLSKVGILLRRPVFTHGQLYVAVSRVTNRAGLKLLCCDEQGNLTNKTTNVVYKEVFRNLQ